MMKINFDSKKLSSLKSSELNKLADKLETASILICNEWDKRNSVIERNNFFKNIK